MDSAGQQQCAVLIGTHVVADLRDIDPSSLRDGDLIASLVREALGLAGFTIITEAIHRFGAPGFGVTGFFLLSESHAAFHSYPEFGYLALDIFSCGAADPQAVVSIVTTCLAATTDGGRVLSRWASGPDAISMEG